MEAPILKTGLTGMNLVGMCVFMTLYAKITIALNALTMSVYIGSFVITLLAFLRDKKNKK